VIGDATHQLIACFLIIHFLSLAPTLFSVEAATPKLTVPVVEFVANKGNTVYIGVVHSASTLQVAHVLKTLEMDNALNLDDGGSAAFWYGGYKVGPGRDVPNVILFVKKITVCYTNS